MKTSKSGTRLRRAKAVGLNRTVPPTYANKVSLLKEIGYSRTEADYIIKNY
jgi:hypothetical protein